MSDANTAHYRHTDFPQQIIVESTAACNQQCIFCGRTYMERPKHHMKRETFEKIADEIARESPYSELWPAFMGESFLLGDKLWEMIRFARNAGCKKLTLNTNGTKLNDRDVIENVLTCGIDRLIVSCDGHTPETHATVRPAIHPQVTGGLKAIYEGIHLLIDTMRKESITSPMLELQFSIFDENEHEAENFRKYWLDQGVIVKVRPKLYWSGLVEGGDHRVRYEGRVPCLWAMDTMGIHWNGSVVMCAVDCDGKYVAGSVDMQTMKEIWNGPLKWLRELQLQHRFAELPEICRSCPDWEVKKAHAYFPSDESEAAYEAYVRKGRIFMEDHMWHEQEDRFR